MTRKIGKHTVTSNVDIIEVCEALDLPLVFCGGKDLIYEVPNKLRKNHFYIINLNNEEGTHWTCLSTFKGYEIYMDPFGVICPPIVHQFVSDIGFKKLYIFDYQLQSVKGTYCGWLCIMWLHFLYQGIRSKKDLVKIINEFLELGFDLDKQEKNYKVILKYISNLF